jgi:fluoride exporter
VVPGHTLLELDPLSANAEEQRAMLLYLVIALGGALGSVARFAVGNLVSSRLSGPFPWGTLIVNATGSFLIGFFFTLTEPGGRVAASSSTRHFFMAGLCGGYTTFSAFSLQTLNLARDGDWFEAGANTVGSVALCFAMVWLGHLCASWLNRTRGA